MKQCWIHLDLTVFGVISMLHNNFVWSQQGRVIGSLKRSHPCRCLRLGPRRCAHRVMRNHCAATIKNNNRPWNIFHARWKKTLFAPMNVFKKMFFSCQILNRPWYLWFQCSRFLEFRGIFGVAVNSAKVKMIVENDVTWKYFSEKLFLENTWPRKQREEQNT